MAAKSYRYFDVVMAVFVATLIVSNVASSAKIVDWGVSIFGLRLAFDAGTLLFPLSYIFDDVLTEVYGYAHSRKVIWTGFACLACAGLYFYLVQKMPGEHEWMGYAGDQSYGAILGGMSSGGIILASLSAYFVGEFSNSFILAKMKVRMKGRHLWMRTIGSTLVGELLDSLTFISIACAFGVFPWEIAPTLIVSNYIFKVAIEVLFTPVTYRIVAFLKSSEQEDYYDRDTNFSPFNIAA